MAAELKVSGRMTVKRLKENFKNEFEGTLRVYDGREKADDNATLASIRRNEDAKGGELVCNGNLTVGSFEKKMLEVFGIKVQVATPDDWMLALDGITLAKLKDITEKTSKADMESLVAYKRKEKSGDVATDVEDTEGIVNADEATANNIDKVESEVEENAENSSGKERLTLKQYILNLVYIFDEFDMDDCDGSYYTKFGKLGEFDLFDEEQIDDVLSDNYIYDGELSKDSFCDEVSEDDLYCVISNLVDNLDQGSIKLMQIKDGSKVIFKVSNDEPFVD